MQSNLRTALVMMCRRVLHPLVRILIRLGISAGELKAIVDSVYAHAGSEYLRSQGERVTYSRLAVITGINRVFLPEILAQPKSEFQPRSNTQLHRASRVLAGWHDDVDFQAANGEPALLSIRGPRSFQQLADQYSGGIYFQTLLSELIRVGAVRRVHGNRVRALRRFPATGGASSESLDGIGETVGDLLETLERNLSAKTNDHLPVRTLTLNVSSRALPLFRAQLARRADGLLEVMDSFLQTHRVEADSTGDEASENERITLGVGVFAICREQGFDATRPTAIGRARRSRVG
jgi:hypothetical protein